MTRLRAAPAGTHAARRTSGGRSPRFGGRTNLGPAISPDGRFLAVFSQVDPFTFSLTLVDVRHGPGRAHPRQHGHGRALRLPSFRQRHPAAGRRTRSSSRSPSSATARRPLRLPRFPAAASSGSSRSRRSRDVSGIAWSPTGDQLVLSGTQDAVGGLWLLRPATGDAEAPHHGAGGIPAALLVPGRDRHRVLHRLRAEDGPRPPWSTGP